MSSREAIPIVVAVLTGALAVAACGDNDGEGSSRADLPQGSEPVDLNPADFTTGADGAQAGIIMPAHPEVGLAYRQEYYAGEAEDEAEIVGLDEQAEPGSA